MALDAIFKQPFAEQVDYFRQKLALPSAAWDDIIGAAHDRAFMVAGAQGVDLLADLFDAVAQAINEGKSIGWFRDNFERIAAARGWTDWTGSDSAAGKAWRTRVVYSTNMSTSYAAGRWQQLHAPEFADRPYWRYVHSDLPANPRPQHQAWHGLVLHRDHPFWRSHFPPNGWGCLCTVKIASAAEIAAAQARGLFGEPPAGWDTRSPDTGLLPGVDRGWDHAPGANLTTDLRELFSARVATLPGPLADAFRRHLETLP